MVDLNGKVFRQLKYTDQLLYMILLEYNHLKPEMKKILIENEQHKKLNRLL